MVPGKITIESARRLDVRTVHGVVEALVMPLGTIDAAVGEDVVVVLEIVAIPAHVVV